LRNKLNLIIDCVVVVVIVVAIIEYLKKGNRKRKGKKDSVRWVVSILSRYEKRTEWKWEH